MRKHLQLAKVTRAALFENSSARRQVRVHDLRGTFVTLALANGKTESWVMDRTGHKSSIMIARYRRASRTASEIGLGDLTPMDEAIPELSDGHTRSVSRSSVSGGRGGEPGPGRILNPSAMVHEGGLEPPSLAAPEPKPGAYASSATRAWARQA